MINLPYDGIDEFTTNVNKMYLSENQKILILEGKHNNISKIYAIETIDENKTLFDQDVVITPYLISNLGISESILSVNKKCTSVITSTKSTIESKKFINVVTR